MIGHIHSIETFGTVDGPGTRFVVFFKGCPMRCAYCHNPDTWELGGGEEWTADKILEYYDENKEFYMNNGGLTATGGEPTVQIDFLLELFTKAKEKGIHTCLDTSGIMFRRNEPAILAKYDALCKVTDLVMLDIKHIDPEGHKELTLQPNDNILDFARYLDEQRVPLWIRHVIVPGITDQVDELTRLGYFIGGLSNLKALDVLPYHTMGIVKYEKLGIEYRLKGVEALTNKDAIEAKKHILDGIRKRRAELNQSHELEEQHKVDGVNPASHDTVG